MHLSNSVMSCFCYWWTTISSVSVRVVLKHLVVSWRHGQGWYSPPSLHGVHIGPSCCWIPFHMVALLLYTIQLPILNYIITNSLQNMHPECRNNMPHYNHKNFLGKSANFFTCQISPCTGYSCIYILCACCVSRSKYNVQIFMLFVHFSLLLHTKSCNCYQNSSIYCLANQ